METFTAVVALTGLYCFPITMIICGIRRSQSRRSVLAYTLLVAMVVSIVWIYFDSKPSSAIRYGALSYAAVMALSAYLYFTRRASDVRAVSMNETTVGKFTRENARYLIIATAILLFGLLYACSHRYQAISDKSLQRILILDRWTGEVKTKY